MQAGIGKGDAHYPNRRQRRTLKQHLRAEQDIESAHRGHAPETTGLTREPSGIGIQPADPSLGEESPDFMLETGGSIADRM
jgi:hypothetical protein